MPITQAPIGRITKPTANIAAVCSNCAVGSPSGKNSARNRARRPNRHTSRTIRPDCPPTRRRCCAGGDAASAQPDVTAPPLALAPLLPRRRHRSSRKAARGPARSGRRSGSLTGRLNRTDKAQPRIPAIPTTHGNGVVNLRGTFGSRRRITSIAAADRDECRERPGIGRPRRSSASGKMPAMIDTTTAVNMVIRTGVPRLRHPGQAWPAAARRAP